jgi:hypothetical protein
MLDEVAANVGDIYLQASQGSYNRGGVAASAGTHDGGGAVDIKVSHLSGHERQIIVREMRRVGFAAWLRTPAQSNWPYHVHAIAIGQADLSSGARAQVEDYKRGRNGLARHDRDDGPRDFVNVTWEKYKEKDTATTPPATPSPSDRIREYGMYIGHSQHNPKQKILVGPTSARVIRTSQTYHDLVAAGVPDTGKVVHDDTIRELSDSGTAAGGIAAPGVDRKRGPG